MTTFHVIGDAFVDLFCYLKGSWPEHGGDACLERPVQIFAGGSSFNTATHLETLLKERGENARVVLHTVFNPTDDHGRVLVDHAASHNLNIVNCYKQSEGDTDDTTNSYNSTGHCVAVVSNGERSFMTHRGCVANFTADDLNLESIADFDGAVHVHVAGYFNVEGFWNGKLAERLQHLIAQRRKLRRLHKTTISMVVQHDATNQWDGGLDDLIPFVDFLIMNELEADRIAEARSSRQHHHGSANDMTVSRYKRWINSFSSVGSVKTVFVVTRGAEGAVAFQKDAEITRISPAICVDVVDPTGAGDAFAAGFLFGLWSFSNQEERKDTVVDEVGDHSRWSTEAIREALFWGCAAGTSSVRIRGASVPSKPDAILEIYQRQKQVDSE